MKNADKIAKIAFILYAALMVWLLFGQRMGNDVQGGYLDKLFENINLVPFKTVGRYMNMLQNSVNGRLNHQAIINLGGNIIMFVPLGFLLPFVTDKVKSFKTCVAMTFLIIFLVELVQFVTLLGSFDVDDIILNIIGAVIGYKIYVKLPK